MCKITGVATPGNILLLNKEIPRYSGGGQVGGLSLSTVSNFFARETLPFWDLRLRLGRTAARESRVVVHVLAPSAQDKAELPACARSSESRKRRTDSNSNDRNNDIS